jgi:hypothetical protein
MRNLVTLDQCHPGHRIQLSTQIGWKSGGNAAVLLLLLDNGDVPVQIVLVPVKHLRQEVFWFRFEVKFLRTCETGKRIRGHSAL